MPIPTAASIDVSALKSRVDLLGLIGRDTQLEHASSTHGGEWAGPCPFCGGTDRFHVQPERGRWWCRQCSPDRRWSDAIAYVMRRDNMTFREACRSLGGDPTALTTRPSAPQSALTPTIDHDPPPAIWQKIARELMAWSETRLFAPEGERALAYLRERRGLTDETIRRWRLGWNPTDGYLDPERWGQPAGKRLWLPRGLVIPAEAEGHVWRVKVRRVLPSDELAGYVDESEQSKIKAKYWAIRGSKPVLFGADDLAGRATVVLTEGELDAILLDQLAGDLAGVATLGSASDSLSGRWVYCLLGARRVLVAYDLDTAGAKGAAKLAAISARVRVVRPVGAKDLTAMYLAGGDPRAWLASALERHAPRDPIVDFRPASSDRAAVRPTDAEVARFLAHGAADESGDTCYCGLRVRGVEVEAGREAWETFAATCSADALDLALSVLEGDDNPAR